MHRPTAASETTDSEGHLKTDSGSNNGATIRGSVILSDGSAPRQLVSIYCDCGGAQTLVAIADAKGVFSFNRGALDVIGNGKPCALRAFLEGYGSETRAIASSDSKSERKFDKLRLQPLSENPAGLTAPSDDQAPKGAKRDYEHALEEAAKGELGNAISQLTKATSAYPQYASAWLSLGIVQLNRGDKPGAEKSWREAVRADGQFALPLIRLAELEAEKGRWRESVEHSAKAIAINATAFPDAYALNAVGNVSLQNLEAAEKSAREGLKLDAEHQYPELEYALGIVLYAKTDTETATKFLRAYLSHSPNGPNAEGARNELAQMEQSARVLSNQAAAEAEVDQPKAAAGGSGPAFASLQEKNAPLVMSTPTHTCLESIARVQVDTRGKLHDPDLTRVQIAVSEDKEIYGYADGKRFSNDKLSEMVGYTFSTTGLFSSIARVLLSGKDAKTAFAGQEMLDGELVFRYNFHYLPPELPWSIDFGKESGVAGEAGWFFIDSSSLILRRVVLHATEIPNNIRLKRLDAEIDYQAETVASRRVLLPYVAQVHVLGLDGTQHVSRMFFNHCRSFTSETTLSFDMTGQNSARSTRDPDPNLPPDLNVIVALQSPVSPAAAMANDIIAASVAQPIVVHGREIVNRGAAIEGHVLPRRGQEAVVVELDRIRTKDGWAPFYARLIALNGTPRAEGVRASRVDISKPASMPDPEIPGVAKIELSGEHAELSPGTQMTWRTEPLTAPVETRAPQLSTPIGMR